MGTSPETSVRLDLSPAGDAANKACLIVRKLDYLVSHQTIKRVTIDVRGNDCQNGG